MTATSRARMPSRQRLARLITEVLAPAPIAAILLLAVSLHSSASLATGLRWAALTVMVVCAVPMAFVLQRVRRGRLTDRHVRLREQRLVPLLVALGAIVCSVLLLIWLGAPRELVVLLVAMIVGAAVCLLITLVWKMSIHTGTVAATALILAIIFGPPYLLLEVLAVLVAWARVELRVHTPAQVIGGGIIGAAVPAAVFLLLR
jgi:hypothetical protein